MINAFTSDPQLISVLLVVYPLFLAFVAWFLLRKKSNKREVYFILGFLVMIGVYVFLPDPAVVQSLYVNQGDYGPVVLYGTVAAGLLVVAMLFFRKHLGER